ncbi:hypothetical protein ONZ45_g12366 [Pleurotus djamor]|nr:hypothetical protein ONZ45_g12366 [Pleurotus djamor]
MTPLPFPHLRTLNLWETDFHALKLFAGPSIVELSLLLNSLDPASDSCIQHISHHTPNLRRLHILDDGIMIHPPVNAFSTMFKSLTKLEYLEISSAWLFATFDSLFPRLQGLKELSVDFRMTDLDRLIPRNLPLIQLASLRMLTLQMPFDDFIRLAGGDRWSMITVCPNLVRLSIPKPHDWSISPNLAFRDIRPLLALSHLQVLDVTIISQLHLTVDEFVEIFHQLPSLVEVSLLTPNCEPPISLTHLVAIITYADNLEKLSLGLQPLPHFWHDLANEWDKMHYWTRPFEKLKQLTVANTFANVELHNVTETARCLAQLLPRGCVLHPGGNEFWGRVMDLLCLKVNT